MLKLKGPAGSSWKVSNFLQARADSQHWVLSMYMFTVNPGQNPSLMTKLFGGSVTDLNATLTLLAMSQ